MYAGFAAAESKESTISLPPGTPLADCSDSRTSQSTALIDWIGRLNRATGESPLAAMEHLATVVRDASGAERVAIHRLVDGRWSRVVNVTRDHRPGTEVDDEPTDSQDIAHDLVEMHIGEDDPSHPASTIPDAGRSTDRISVPLVRSGTCAVLEIRWSERRPLDPDSRVVIETAATLATFLLHDSRLTEITERRARLHQAVTNGAGILVSTGDDDGILTKLVDAYTDLVGARLCAIALVDAKNTTITALATRGTSRLQGPIPLGDLPHSLLGPVERRWAVEPTVIDLDDDPWLRDVAGGAEAGAAWYRLVPLILGHDACGAVVLGFDSDRRLDPEESLAIDALTGIASAVLERGFQARRRERQVRRLDALHRLNSALAQGDDAPALVRHINELLVDGHVEVISLAFADRRLARRLHGDALTKTELEPRFRHGVRGVTDGGDTSIPMRTGGKLVGAMRIRTTDLDPEAHEFVEGLAQDLAGAVVRDQVRAAVTEADRQQSLATDHQRIAHDLHDSVGQLFGAIRLLGEDHAESLPPGSTTRDRVLRMAELAAKGKREIDHAIRGLALMPSGSDDIAGALRKLAREVANDSGIAIEAHTRGSRTRLDADVERALFRVAHEALANAWRHACCARIDLELSFTPESVVLRVVDDGVGRSGHESDEGVPTVREGTGIAGMRRVVGGLGGHIGIRHLDPHGTVVEVQVPVNPP